MNINHLLTLIGIILLGNLVLFFKERLKLTKRKVYVKIRKSASFFGDQNAGKETKQ